MNAYNISTKCLKNLMFYRIDEAVLDNNAKSWGRYLKIVFCCYWETSTISRTRTICKHATEMTQTSKDPNGLEDFYSIENNGLRIYKEGIERSVNITAFWPILYFFPAFWVRSSFCITISQHVHNDMCI